MVRGYFGKLIKVKELAPRVNLYSFDLGEKFNFVPGQFVMLDLSEEKEVIRRAYSIASDPGEKVIELCIELLPNGKASAKLEKLKIGKKVKISGPYGKFGKDLLKAKRDIVFVSTGTGIAPFKTIVQNLLNQGFSNKIILIHGFRHEENALFQDFFSKLDRRHKNFSFVQAVSRPKNKKEKGRVTNFIKNYVNDHSDYVVCGQREMVLDVKEILSKKKVLKERIHGECW